jgi:hypothetical protein
MGFKISTSPRFWQTVQLQMKDENGKDLKGEIKVQFSRLERDAYVEFNERNKEVPISQAIFEVMHDWRGAQDDNGDVPFDRDAVTTWCNQVPGSWMAIVSTFAKVHNGAALLKEVREGN